MVGQTLNEHKGCVGITLFQPSLLGTTRGVDACGGTGIPMFSA